jgi:pyruvate/2-oxoglutarate dehydrogenase complex dihydrolipoamide acyltransferase (E2) component
MWPTNREELAAEFFLHRLIDGAIAARVLDHMAGYLETKKLFDLV